MTKKFIATAKKPGDYFELRVEANISYDLKNFKNKAEAEKLMKEHVKAEMFKKFKNYSEKEIKIKWVA